MNGFWGNLIGVNIVALMVAFVGIWIWAWLPHHKREFDELAQLPMHDEEGTSVPGRDRSR